jgi:predicted transposase YbfD/YdcC
MGMPTNIPQPLLNLKAQLQTIADPRTGRAKRHDLLDILLISLCASLCGAQTFTDIALWGRCQQDWLQTWLALPRGIPSHDTFNRVFGLINPDHFRDVFIAWTQSLRRAVAAEVVAVDGKSLRGSATATTGPLHLVNVWASANRLLLGQWKVADHSKEITALPALLRALELTGCIVTVDALNCQKNIAKEIRMADADFVLALKSNHAVLHTEVQTFLDDAIARGWRDVPHATHTTVGKEHGRHEQRRYWTPSRLTGGPTRPSGKACAASRWWKPRAPCAVRPKPNAATT